MAARIANFVQSNIFTKCTNILPRRGGIFEKTTQKTLCNRCLRFRNHTTSSKFIFVVFFCQGWSPQGSGACTAFHINLCLCIIFLNMFVGYNGEKRSMDKPQKRKVLRKIKAEICSQNISNPEMEKAARSRKRVLELINNKIISQARIDLTP